MTKILIALLFVCTPLYADKTENEENHFEEKFLRMGELIIQFLNETEEGHAIVEKFNLDLTILNHTLTMGEPDMNGLDHSDAKQDVHYLVFHKMLSETGVYDDKNFRISNHIRPFPQHQKRCNCPNDYPKVQKPVWALRKQFRLGNGPTEAELQLKEEWTCVHYDAGTKHPGQHHHPNELRFETNDQSPFVYESVGGKGSWSESQIFRRSFDPIRDTFGEFQSIKRYRAGRLLGFRTQSIRVNKRGDLIVEQTTTNRIGFLPLRGIADYKNLVASYGLCKTEW